MKMYAPSCFGVMTFAVLMATLTASPLLAHDAK